MRGPLQDRLFTAEFRALEFAQRQRDGTARGADGRRQTAQDAHKQGENDASDK